MLKRVISFLLVFVLLVSILTGCNNSEEKGPDENPSDHPQNESEHLGSWAFQPEYIPIELGEEYRLEYINRYCISGDWLYFYGDCMMGQEPWIDEVTGEPVIDELTGEPYMNTIFETRLFRMNLNTKEITLVDSYHPYDIPDGYEGSTYIQGIQFGENGSFWITEQVNTYFYDLPADFDPEQDDPYAYYQQGDNHLFLHQFDKEGVLSQTIELQVQPDTYLNNIMICQNGMIVSTDWESVLCFDMTGKQVASITVEGSINNIMDMGSGRVAVWLWSENGSYLYPVDMETMTLGESILLEPTAYTLYGGRGDYDYIYDYNGTFYGHKAGAEQSEKLFSWLDCDVDSSGIYDAVFAEDGRVYALQTMYDEAEQRSTFELVQMNPVDPSTLPVKQELVLACFYLDWEIRSDIVEFNRSHEDVRIVVKEYAQYGTEENSLAGLQKLNTEIMSGMVPDLFLLNMEMPVDQYTANDVFMDLWPLIDSDPELSREDLMTHFFDCLSVDGKLYQIVDSFAISTLAGKSSVVGTGNSWTMSELMAALEQQPEGTTIFGHYDTKDSILTNCISRNAESFIDWTTLQCAFDSQEFIDLLTFANQFPSEIDYDKLYAESPEMEMSEAYMLRSGKQMLYQVNLYSFSMLQWANAVFGEDASFIGYPTTGENGSCFEINGGLAISSSCSNVDAAWSFIRRYLTEEHQIQDYMYQFPTNRHAFDVLAERAMTTEFETDYATGEKVPVPSTSIWYGMEENLMLYAMTQEELDLFMDIYNRCTNFYSYHQEITNLISEEAAAFFDGHKTAEETARLIQDRIGLYVMEQG